MEQWVPDKSRWRAPFRDDGKGCSAMLALTRESGMPVTPVEQRGILLLSPHSPRTPRARKDTAQAQRFIAAAREADCSEDEAEIRENMKRLAVARVGKTKPTEER